MLRSIIASAAAVALLAGCVSTASGPVVTLGSAQAEAQAILTALQAGATVYTTAPTTTPSEAAAVENVLNVAKASVAAFETVSANESAVQLAETASTDIEAVLAVLPIDPVTKTAIDAGMAVIDALVAGFAAAPAPLVPTLALRTLPPAPVPIPMPHRLPPTGSATKA